MLARYSLGEEDAALAIERAVADVLERGPRTADLCGEGDAPATTTAFGDAVIASLTRASMPAGAR
jgi:3-isopropylmalate dehydrogenase